MSTSSQALATDVQSFPKLKEITLIKVNATTMGVQGMNMLKATEMKPTNPDKPSLTSRFLRVVNLRKWGTSLFLVSVVSVTTLVLAGPAVLADTSFSGSAFEAVAAVDQPPIGFEDKSVFAKLLGLGAVIFWLVLAAVNLRRCGVKDFQSDNRIAMSAQTLLSSRSAAN